MAYTFDNPIRKLLHPAHTVIGPYVHDGMKVMDVGCGMGHFSIGMARLVGDKGKVVAIDMQQKMLDVTLKRASRAGVADRIVPHLCRVDDIGIEESADFILAFWMVHEVLDKERFFDQLKSRLRDNGKILIAEPRMHVSPEALNRTVEIAQSRGLYCCDTPVIRISNTALLKAE
jgi:2-polyprenyl-3-methyl-5-hydroxy-6-metoxy-1,4-benzoquinol methylase